jgi:hypothetical protein
MWFDTPNEEAAREYQPMEPGTYRFLVETESKTSKYGDQFVSMTLSCVDDPYKGRKVWHNFMMQHKNPTVVLIAKSHMKAFLEAVGHTAPVRREAEFHEIALNKVIPVAIGIKANKETNELQNIVKSFLPKGPRAAVNPQRPPMQRAVGQTQQSGAQPQPPAWASEDIPF